MTLHSPFAGGSLRISTMRRTVLFVVVLVLCLGLATFGWWAWGPDELEGLAPNVVAGMKLNEVESILGPPRGSNSFPDGTKDYDWLSARVHVIVVFGNDGVASRIIVHRLPLWDRVRKRMPW